jgi:hypothetical protein
MTTRVVTISFFITVIFVGAALSDTPHEADLDLQEIVRNLGLSKSSKKIMDDIHKIATTPRESAKLLIEEIHIIPDDVAYEKQDSSNMDHVIWSLDALRYITGGKEFCSRTRHRFLETEEEKNRAYWLELTHGKCLTFFAIWPSRGRIYLAPRDAQARIIALWGDWYKRHARDYSFHPLVKPEPQDWLWN